MNLWFGYELMAVQDGGAEVSERGRKEINGEKTRRKEKEGGGNADTQNDRPTDLV